MARSRRLAPLALLALALAGCLVSEDNFNAVKAERDKFRTRVAQLEDELDQAKGKVRELETQLESSKDKKPTRPPKVQVLAAYAELHLDEDDELQAVLATSKGDISCELFPNIAPVTVLNFVGLVEGTKEWTDPRTGTRTREPLYDGTKFHRVIDGFMIQGGDPLGSGRGGPGYSFPDEVWPDVRFDRPGVLAMANSGPDTNGSQFFITSSPQPSLNMRHTIFGLCDVETVGEIMKVPVGGEEKSTPTKDVLLQKVRIVRPQTPPPAAGR